VQTPSRVELVLPGDPIRNAELITSAIDEITPRGIRTATAAKPRSTY
jgi:hypothetical protein